HLVAETFAAEAFRVMADGARVERAIKGAGDRVGERPWARLADEQARFARYDGLERATASERHDRTAACLGFERHDAEILLARQQHDRCPAVQLANLHVRTASEELHVA